MLNMSWLEEAVFLLSLLVSVFAGTDEYFESECGQTIDIGNAKTIESGTGWSDIYYGDNEDCTVILNAGVGKKVLVTWDYYDVQGTPGGCDDTLKIYNGNSTTDTKLNTEDCGSHTSSYDTSRYDSFASDSNHMCLRLQSDGSNGYNRFKFHATSFTTTTGASCAGSNQFRCDNGRCIAETLTYDNSFDWDDNCGDWSDLNGYDLDGLANAVGGLLALGLGIMIAVIVGSLVGGILICVCCGCLCYHLFCKNKTQPGQVTVVHAPPPPQNGVQVQQMNTFQGPGPV